MALGTLEIMALITIVIAAVKIVTLLINPKAWLDMSKGWFKNVGLMQLICLIIAAVALYFLYQSGVGIVQVLAVMLFASFIIGAALAPYGADLMKAIKPKDMISKNIPVLVIWVALLLWGLKEIFM